MSGLILLTGASGFVGQQVLRELCEKGKRVRLVTRAYNFSNSRYRDCIESVVHSPDLFAEDSEWWCKVCSGIDIVIHLAWYAEPGKYLMSEKNIDCLSGSLQFAKGAADAGIKKFVGIGTCFEYDLTGGVLSINTGLDPLTPYAATKAAAFLSLSQWFLVRDISFAWCRLFYMYGEGEDTRRLVPYIRDSLAKSSYAELTSGTQIRDFIDVREAGALIVNTALGDRQGAVNICSGVPITVRQLAEKIADEFGRRDLLKFNARADNITDPPCVLGIP